MKAEDVLPDGVDRAAFGGVAVRKGTVAAFLRNARAWCDADTGADARARAERDMLDALPALRAVGLFEVMAVRDPRLARLVTCGVASDDPVTGPASIPARSGGPT